MGSGAAQHSTIILRPDENTAYFLQQGADVVRKSDLTGGLQNWTHELLDRVDLSEATSEHISGEQTMRHYIAGEDIEGLIWFTHDGIIVRFNGRSRVGDEWTTFTYELDELERGAIDAAIFKPPPKLRIVEAEAHYQPKND